MCELLWHTAGVNVKTAFCEDEEFQTPFNSYKQGDTTNLINQL